MKSLHALPFLLAVAALLAPRAQAASVAAGAAKDNTLYAESDTLSNGAGQRFFAGRSGTGHTRRGLIEFDLTGLVPAGATVDSVVLQLNLAQTSAGTRAISLHRVLAPWGEGTSAAVMGEGGGAPATPGDATWGQRFFGQGQPWAAPGGDHQALASASRPVGGVGVYAWRSAGMMADVAYWLQNPAANFGWELMGNETDAASAKAFSSRQAALASARPVLTIYYTEAPTGAGPLAPAAKLFPPHPNPFNPSATIRYSVARTGHVRLAVYDVRGRLVRVLADDIARPGTHDVRWHGEDSRGMRVSSGVYLVKLDAGGAPAQVEKLLLLK